MPSATPTDVEIATWQAPPRDVQIKRMREALTSAAASTPSGATMAEIWAETEARASAHAGYRLSQQARRRAR